MLLSLLLTAQKLVAAGLSVIPIKTDGSKAPALPAWKPYQQQRPTNTELRHWFAGGEALGIAVIGGEVSSSVLGAGLEILDFDAPGLYEEWAALCADQGLGPLLDTLPLAATGGGGRHIYYRAPHVPGNTKLAQRWSEEKNRLEVLIETRGEGGYAVIPPSPAACHPDQRPYEYLHGSLEEVPVLTAAQRDELHGVARALNEWYEPDQVERAPKRERPAGGGLSPGDDYNARASWDGLLTGFGMTRKRTRGEEEYWGWADNGRAICATVNHAGSGLFYTWSTVAHPFAAEKAYDLFGAYARLSHGGDFGAAARALAAEGYGEPAKPRGSGYPPPPGDADAPPPQGGGSAPQGGGSAPQGGGSAHGASGGSVPEAEDWEAPVMFGPAHLPPFPVSALPPELGRYVAEVAASTQVPIDMAALMGLACVAVAGARRCCVQVGDTHTETLNLYIAAVMEPGSRKSSTLEAFAEPLRAFERQTTLALSGAHALAKERKEGETRRLSHLRDRTAKENNEIERRVLEDEVRHLLEHMEEVTELPRLLADDVTMERLAGLLAEQEDNCIAMLSAEGGIFGILAGRYANGATNLDLILKGHGGETHRVDRVGQPPRYIKRPTITMGLAVQPDVLRTLADNPAFRGRGLLGRFLYTLPENLVGTRVYRNRPVDPDAKDRYEQMLLALLRLPSPLTREDPGLRHALRLSGDALALWKTHHDGVEQRQSDGEDLAGISDWASKLAGGVARIAGNLHLVIHHLDAAPWTRPISRSTVADAWAIGEYLIPHALAAFNQMGVDIAHALARKVLKWVSRTRIQSFTVRECFRTHQSSATLEEVQGALAVLEAHGYLRLGEEIRAGPGRKPSPRYLLNPALLAAGERPETSE